VSNDILTAGRAFLNREGRLIERRLAAVLFEGADPSGVVDAVRAYRNPDGGFGHGLEPDKRCPASLPIDVECALDILLMAGADGTSGDAADGSGALGLHGLVLGACDWLDRATGWTWKRLESGFDEDAHALSEVLVFLAHVPDRGRAEAVGVHVGTWLANAQWFRADPADPAYGVTPLHLASSPDSPWRRLFDNVTIEGHLDRLALDQQPDGGWAITWQPPAVASTLEWRGIETLRALRTLRAYGRL
jgi:hypothetical protein